MGCLLGGDEREEGELPEWVTEMTCRFWRAEREEGDAMCFLCFVCVAVAVCGVVVFCSTAQLAVSSVEHVASLYTPVAASSINHRDCVVIVSSLGAWALVSRSILFH